VPIPAFGPDGDLPVAVHAASLPEILFRFGGGSAARRRLALRLARIHELAEATGHLRRFVIFGSFATEKRQPNDVDVFMVMDDNFDVARISGETQLLFDHASAQTHFGASEFWLRRCAAFGGEQAAIEDWQIKRDGGLRGIVEVRAKQP
jgi:hypothetical protein